ncbi:MAG TPA: helix-turn-helix transcriptional regulator [Steroidobacteraceae bacterium]|nr:helix-turn-helix transcriptional regulator [Steroidobacteraceae bacterium]
MKLTPGLTDAAMLEELGARLARRRIDANLTQAGLAEEAGVSKRTLERLEAGRSTDFTMLVRVLRALKLIEGLDGVIPDTPQSPLALLRHKGAERKRVGHRRSEAAMAGTSAGPWKWRE